MAKLYLYKKGLKTVGI